MDARLQQRREERQRRRAEYVTSTRISTASLFVYLYVFVSQRINGHQHLIYFLLSFFPAVRPS